MGLATPIAASIVLAGIIGSTASLIACSLYTTQLLLDASASWESSISGSKLELANLSATNSSVEFSVTNLGPRPVSLLESESGYSWCSVLTSYRTPGGWRTFLIDNYHLVEINVPGTGLSFDPETHRFLNPGETARISATIPLGAPEIPIGKPIVVVFVTRFGEVAQFEGVRQV